MKIERIDLFPVRYPTEGYFRFFEGPRGAYGRGAVIVKMTADDGTVGWGQSVPSPLWSYETPETAEVVLRDYLAPAVLGLDPRDLPALHRALDRALAPGFSTGMPISRSGLDFAAHDLAGRLAGWSLPQMWGINGDGDRDGGPEPVAEITLSWTVDVTSVEVAAESVAAGRQRGYRNFNIKVGPDPNFDQRLARTVRELAPDSFLWADANCSYAPEAALQAAPRLADAGVDVLEAPVRPNRIRAHQALKRQGALPILMDEGVVSAVDLEEFIHLEMLDGLAMKPSRSGGLVDGRRQIEICRDKGLLWLGSGLTDPDISMAVHLVLYGAYGLKTPAAMNGPQFLTYDVLVEPIQVQSGVARVPTGPGLGVTVDEQKVLTLMERSKQTPSTIR